MENGEEKAKSYERHDGKKKGNRKHFQAKKKPCKLCAEHIKNIDYKQIQIVKLYCSDTGRILPRKVTGACAKHQRQIARAIKINRNLSILPYTA